MRARVRWLAIALVLSLVVAAHGVASDYTVIIVPYVDIAARPAGDGYWVVTSEGRVQGFGAAGHHGDLARVNLNRPIVGIASTGSGNGYWLVGADGGIFTFGDAPYLGGMAGYNLVAPISAIDRVGSTNWYILLGEDGGVFAISPYYFGRAHPVGRATGIATTPSAHGYFVMGSRGGPQEFGDASVPSGQGADHGDPFVDIATTPTGQGSFVAEDDGRVSVHGDAIHRGDASSFPLLGLISAIATTPSGQGYWLLGRDGGVFAFGDAPFLGTPRNTPIPVP